MIRLEIELDNIDYDMLIDQFLPKITDELRQSGNPIAMLLSNGMSSSAAKKILHGLSQETKDKLAVDILKANKNKLLKNLQDYADKQNIHGELRKVDISSK